MIQKETKKSFDHDIGVYSTRPTDLRLLSNYIARFPRFFIWDGSLVESRASEKLNIRKNDT